MSEPIEASELPPRVLDTARRIWAKHSHDGYGDFSYTQSSDSGIGIAYEMTCNVCGKVWDLSDYRSW